MGFLAPLYLALAGAAAVPVLLHFLRRRTGARVAFPAARYIARAEQEHSRQLKVRDLLLLLLRVLAVLLLAAAAAGPVAAIGGAGHPLTALAVVLDNSLSTTAISGGAPTLDPLRAAAVRALAAAHEGDRLWLVTADGRVQGGRGPDLARAAAAVRPLDGAGDVRAAVERAATLVRATGLPNAAVAVATDGQASAWRVPAALGSVRVALLVPSALAPADVGVASAAARPPRWSPSGAVVARVVRSGAAPAGDSVAYRMLLGAGRTVARGAARPSPAADSAGGLVEARVAAGERGWLAGVVSVTPDEFRGDDSAFFAAFGSEAPAVRAAPDAGPFVGAAVASLVASGHARAAAGSGGVTLAPADAEAPLPAILFAPASPVRVGAANRALERAGIPWRLGAPRAGTADLRAGAGDLSLGAARATARYALTPAGPAAADAAVLVTAGGEPWAVAGPGYVLVGSPADPAATTLPVSAAWVPWLGGAAARVTAGTGDVVAATPGAVIVAPAGSASIVDGAGRVVSTVAGTRASAPAARGVYFFSRGAGAAGERLGALVVNLESEELVLDRASDQDLARRLRGGAGHADVSVTRDAGVWVRSVYSGGARRPVSGALLALALLALAAESAATRVGANRRTRAEAH